MVDVHCHLTDEAYKDDLEEIIKNADEAGVMMITNGTSIEDSKRAVEIAEKYPSVWACAGIHPEEITNNQIPSYKDLEEMFNHNKVVGVGEIGLNYYQGISEDEKKNQIELFKTQLSLAEKYILPVEIHNRAADSDILEIINKYKIVGVMHCFTRNQDFMMKCIEKGFYISFGGLIAYPNNGRMVKMAKITPEDKLLLETDSPYSFPEYGDRTRNQPKNVKIVAELIAKNRNASIDQIEDMTESNTRRLFTRMVQ